VFASIRAAWPEAYVCALTRDYTRGLLEGQSGIDDVVSFESSSNHIPAGAFMKTLSEIRSRKFDAAVALFSNFSVAALLAMAGIPVRIGPASKAAQIFFTHRIKQRRSKGQRHEADHNLDLLAPLGVTPVRRAELKVSDGARKVFAKTDGRPLVGIHPGSGGSSRNWPESNYSRLASGLAGAGVDVALTGSAAERGLVERIANASGNNAQVYIGKNGVMELAGALSELDVFVAPSTGPLHIASAVGTPVVGIYCPIFVCLPQRWGPIGPNDSAIVPDVEPCERCVGGRCAQWDCMDKISVERVKEEVLGKITSPART